MDSEANAKAPMLAGPNSSGVQTTVRLSATDQSVPHGVSACVILCTSDAATRPSKLKSSLFFSLHSCSLPSCTADVVVEEKWTAGPDDHGSGAGSAAGFPDASFHLL